MSERVPRPPLPIGKSVLIIGSTDHPERVGTFMRQCHDTVHVYADLPGWCQCGERYWDRGKTVYWEDDPTRTREVTGVCSTCKRIMEREYGQTLTTDAWIVSPSGIGHSGGEWGKTDCGRDATGEDWWWRL